MFYTYMLAILLSTSPKPIIFQYVAEYRTEADCKVGMQYLQQEKKITLPIACIPIGHEAV